MLNRYFTLKDQQTTRKEIKDALNKSIKDLTESLDQAKRDSHSYYYNYTDHRNCLENLITSQKEILAALEAKQNATLLSDNTDTLLQQHIHKSLILADRLEIFLSCTRNEPIISPTIVFNIEQLTAANSALASAILSPENISQPVGNTARTAEVYNRYNEDLETRIKQKREHLPWQDELRLHLKKNALLVSLIAIGAAAIILAVTVPPLAPIIFSIPLILFGVVTVFSTAFYKCFIDKYPLTEKRAIEESKKDLLFTMHCHLFKHANANAAYINAEINKPKITNIK